MTFLLDWELTMKCNLDCSYCSTDLQEGGHNNSVPHPKLDDCLRSLDFMFEYVDVYMSTRTKGLKHVVLNVYGGESLYHPDIVEILQAARDRYQTYQNSWTLTITTTTNAIVSSQQLNKIIPLIDEFTVSYHSEALPKQKNQFKQNVLSISAANKRIKCVVLMHADPDLFADSQHMIAWLDSNNVRYLPRQLDHAKEKTEFNYSTHQVVWFKDLYSSRARSESTQMPDTAVDHNQNTDLTDTGRACCGGRQLCADSNYKDRNFYVSNKFPGWYCSVNYFFLFVKQVTQEVYVNKDCKMNFNGTVGPIGSLSNTQAIIDFAKRTDRPTIQCARYLCRCGLCAPKAADQDIYKTIMKKYEIPNSNLLQKT
jgi:hypothetical protein